MNKRIYLVFAVLCFFAFNFSAFAEEGWLTSLDEGLKKGKTEGKRVLVDFTATWCGWCTKLKSEVFDKKEFQDYSGKNLVLVSIDADVNKDVVDKYKVEGFPTVMIMDGEGKTLDSIVGFKPLDGFLEVLKKTEVKLEPKPASTASETKPAEEKK